MNVNEPYIPKHVNALVAPGIKVKDYIEDGEVLSGGRSAQASAAVSQRSGAKKVPGSPIKIKKTKINLDASITAKDLKLDEAFASRDYYKNMTK